jgi:hypothetical protein
MIRLKHIPFLRAVVVCPERFKLWSQAQSNKAAAGEEFQGRKHR